MEIGREDLSRAVEAGIVTDAQADALWAALGAPRAAESPDASASQADKPRFDFVHVAYYFGALLVIGAMGWFMGNGWESLGGGGIFAVSCGYALVFVLVGRVFGRNRDLRTPGGLLIVMAVGMTPLAIYGLERLLHLWPAADPGGYSGFHEWVKGGWFAMEVATVLAGAIALHYFRFPFLTAPIAFVLWYMSMDLAPLLFGASVSWNQRSEVSAAVGALMLAAAFAIDRRTEQDFSFWLYLFGLAAFWGGLSSMESTSQARKLIYLAINLGLMGTSVVLNRRAFIVFGALGVMGYIGQLSYEVFKDSALFPIVLSGVGLAIIALGVHARRNVARYERAILGLVPVGVRRWLPQDRRFS